MTRFALRTICVTRLAAAALVLPLAGPAWADDMAFFMKNLLPRAVAIELYSQDRQTVWPGRDKVYRLNEGEQKSVTVSCNTGETICYGAWLNGDARTYFGVGPDNAHTCKKCCAVCEDRGSVTIELGP